MVLVDLAMTAPHAPLATTIALPVGVAGHRGNGEPGAVGAVTAAAGAEATIHLALPGHGRPGRHRGRGAVLQRRVLLVDDHPMFRHGLRRLLEETGRYQVVGEAQSGHEAIRLADVEHPELVVLDVQLPGLTGLQVARILHRQHPLAKLAVLSIHVDDGRLFEAIRAGVAAYLLKDLDVESLLVALGRVLAGENLIQPLVLERPDLARRVLAEFRTLPGDGPPRAVERSFLPLSARELEVLDCVAQGLSNKETAAALFITEQTVKNHMTAVLRKLDVNDRVGAVLHAVKRGWMELGPPPYADGAGSRQ